MTGNLIKRGRLYSEKKIFDFLRKINVIKGNKNYSKFILLGQGRTGSNFLTDLLKSHKQVVMFHEVFEDDKPGKLGYTGYRCSEAMAQLKKRDPVKFLDEVIFSPSPKRVKAVGFKLFYEQIERFKCIFQHLKEMDKLKIIHLRRRNMLRPYLSYKIAFRQKKWLFEKGDYIDQSPIYLDYDEVLKSITTYDKLQRESDSFFDNNQKITVFYEDLITDFENETKRIEEFLQIRIQPLKTRYVRQTTKPLSELILNYKELKKRFEGTPWVEFFEE